MSHDIAFADLSLRDTLDLAIFVEEEAKERYDEFAEQMDAHRVNVRVGIREHDNAPLFLTVESDVAPVPPRCPVMLDQCLAPGDPKMPAKADRHLPGDAHRVRHLQDIDKRRVN